VLECNIVESKRVFTTKDPMDPPTRLLCGQVPHHFTGVVTPLARLRSQAPIYLTRDGSAKGLLASVKACGISHVKTRGSTVLDMSHLRDPTSLAALRCLRCISAGGSPLSPKVIQDVLRIAEPSKLLIVNSYGCTE
jgi:acyl-CoA synthetase (AMP-forming)/AMP-acid ligase II